MNEKINIEKAIKDFVYYLEFEENKKNNTVISIRKDLNNFLEYLNKKNIITLDKLDELIIKEYLTELKDFDLSNSTYNRRLSSIKKFHKYLINNNLKEKFLNICKFCPFKIFTCKYHNRILPQIVLILMLS